MRQTLDRRRHRPAHVHEREDLRIGKALAQHFERLLAATHAGQPVVNERDVHVRAAGLDRRAAATGASPTCW